MKLETLQHDVGTWSRRNFPNNHPYSPLLGALEELGELAHAHLKLEQGIRGSTTEHVLAKSDAVGDIVIYLADYCERNNIDLDAAVTNAWNMVKLRDWVKFPKDGVSC
jgi:NTP pyrophosphatase (non-canonical NTP hydrolase)